MVELRGALHRLLAGWGGGGGGGAFQGLGGPFAFKRLETE